MKSQKLFLFFIASAFLSLTLANVAYATPYVENVSITPQFPVDSSILYGSYDLGNLTGNDESTFRWYINGVSQEPCYQEQANESTVCGGLDTGSYSTLADQPDNYITVNYTVPSGYLPQKAYVTMGAVPTSANYTIPSVCVEEAVSSGSYVARLESFTGMGVSRSSYECYNGTGWTSIISFTGATDGSGSSSETLSEEERRALAFDGNHATFTCWNAFLGSQWMANSCSFSGLDIANRNSARIYEEGIWWGASSTMLPASSTSVGDVVVFEVTPSNGTSTGTPVNSSSVTILAGEQSNKVIPFSNNIVFWSDLNEGMGTPTDQTGKTTNISLVLADWNNTAPTNLNYSLRINATTSGQSVGLKFTSQELDTLFGDAETVGVCSWINTGNLNGVQGIAELRFSESTPYSTLSLWKSTTSGMNLRTTRASSWNSSLSASLQNKSRTVTSSNSWGSGWNHVCWVVDRNVEPLFDITEYNQAGNIFVHNYFFFNGVGGIGANGSTTSQTFSSGQTFLSDAVGEMVFGSAMSFVTSPSAELVKNIAQPVVFKLNKSQYDFQQIITCMHNSGAGRKYEDFIDSCVQVRILEPRIEEVSGGISANYTTLWSAQGTGVDASTYKWFVNGVLESGETTPFFSDSLYSSNDRVTVEITPSDGINNGSAINVSYPFSISFAYPINNSQLAARQTLIANHSFPDPANTYVAFFWDGPYTSTLGTNARGMERYLYDYEWRPANFGQLGTRGLPQGKHTLEVFAWNKITNQTISEKIYVVFNNTDQSNVNQFGTDSASLFPSGYQYPRATPDIFAQYKGYRPYNISVNSFLDYGAGGHLLTNNGDYLSFDWSANYILNRGTTVALIRGSGLTNHSGTDCISGECIGFLGNANSFVNGTAVNNFATGATTTTNEAFYSFWVRPESSSQASSIASTIGGAWNVRLAGSDNLTLQWRTTAADSYTSSNTSMVINNWNHVLLVNNNTNKRMFLNGVEVGSGTAIGAASVILTLGNNGAGGTDYFIGKIDEWSKWTNFNLLSTNAINSNCYGYGASFNCTLDYNYISNFLYNNATGRFAFEGYEGRLDNTSSLGYGALKNIELTPGQSIGASGPRFNGLWYSYGINALGERFFLGSNAGANLIASSLFSNNEWAYAQFGQEVPQESLRPNARFWNESLLGPIPTSIDTVSNLSVWMVLCETVTNGTSYCTSDDQGVQTFFSIELASEDAPESNDSLLPYVQNAVLINNAFRENRSFDMLYQGQFNLTADYVLRNTSSQFEQYGLLDNLIWYNDLNNFVPQNLYRKMISNIGSRMVTFCFWELGRTCGGITPGVYGSGFVSGLGGSPSRMQLASSNTQIPLSNDSYSVALWFYDDNISSLSSTIIGGPTWSITKAAAPNINVLGTSHPIPLFTWIPIVVTHNTTSGVISAYVNGTLVATDSTGNSASNRNNINFDGAGEDSLSVYIDEFAIWNGVLNSTQITGHALNGSFYGVHKLQDQSTYRWFRNGSLIVGQNSSTLPSSEFHDFNAVYNITLEITPKTANETGTPYNVSTIVRGPVAKVPSIQNFAVYNNTRREEILVYDDIPFGSFNLTIDYAIKNITGGFGGQNLDDLVFYASFDEPIATIPNTAFPMTLLPEVGEPIQFSNCTTANCISYVSGTVSGNALRFAQNSDVYATINTTGAKTISFWKSISNSIPNTVMIEANTNSSSTSYWRLSDDASGTPTYAFVWGWNGGGSTNIRWHTTGSPLEAYTFEYNETDSYFRIYVRGWMYFESFTNGVNPFDNGVMIPSGASFGNTRGFMQFDEFAAWNRLLTDEEKFYFANANSEFYTDHEARDVSTYRWFKDGSLLVGETTRVLNSSYFAQPDTTSVITAEVTPRATNHASAGVPQNYTVTISGVTTYFSPTINTITVLNSTNQAVTPLTNLTIFEDHTLRASTFAHNNISTPGAALFIDFFVRNSTTIILNQTATVTALTDFTTNSFQLPTYGAFSYNITIRDETNASTTYTQTIQAANRQPIINSVQTYRGGTPNTCQTNTVCELRLNLIEDGCSLARVAESVVIIDASNTTLVNDTSLVLASSTLTTCQFRADAFTPAQEGNHTYNVSFTDNGGLTATATGSFVVTAATTPPPPPPEVPPSTDTPTVTATTAGGGATGGGVIIETIILKQDINQSFQIVPGDQTIVVRLGGRHNGEFQVVNDGLLPLFVDIKVNTALTSEALRDWLDFNGISAINGLQINPGQGLNSNARFIRYDVDSKRVVPVGQYQIVLDVTAGGITKQHTIIVDVRTSVFAQFEAFWNKELFNFGHKCVQASTLDVETNVTDSSEEVCTPALVVRVKHAVGVLFVVALGGLIAVNSQSRKQKERRRKL